eukprot:883926-Amphidinium_carterae.1
MADPRNVPENQVPVKHHAYDEATGISSIARGGIQVRFTQIKNSRQISHPLLKQNISYCNQCCKSCNGFATEDAVIMQ